MTIKVFHIKENNQEYRLVVKKDKLVLESKETDALGRDTWIHMSKCDNLPLDNAKVFYSPDSLYMNLIRIIGQVSTQNMERNEN